MKKQILLAVPLILSLPQLTLAHAGDHSEAGVLHLFTSPYHMAALIGLVALSGYFLTRPRKEEIKNKKQRINKR